MKRRDFLRVASLTSVAAVSSAGVTTAGPKTQGAPRAQRVKAFEYEEKGVLELQRLMEERNLTSVSLTKKYLARIAEIDRKGPELRAVIEVNPDAISIAAHLDKERKNKGSRGPLHGIPVLIKDNIDTRDHMTTTAGSLALLGSIPPRDSFVAQKLREAGAVILGKTNLSEWANFRGDRSSSGWSARGGQTRNPYVLDRNPSGSSSGSAVAVSANLCAVAVGTETDGSILSPSSYNGIVGVKPTLGLISRSGIIPIAHSQDTAGPMARSVQDAALLLNALAGSDPGTRNRPKQCARSCGLLFRPPPGLPQRRPDWRRARVFRLLHANGADLRSGAGSDGAAWRGIDRPGRGLASLRYRGSGSRGLAL